MANSAEPSPYLMAAAQAAAQTDAVCDDGIPPVPKSISVTENFFNLKIPVQTFNICATNHAITALART
jgi:hypothetical protein